MRAALITVCLTALLHCGGATPQADAGPSDTATSSTEPRLDLLLVIDNSGSMYSNQQRFSASLAGFLDALAAPLQDGRVLRDLHVGVISTDLGSPDGGTAGCQGRGDDGRLNPNAHRAFESPHRDPRCRERSTRDILRSDLSPERRSDLLLDLHCQVFMSTFGCGIEQPLEAARRALMRRPGDELGPFLRSDSVLAIVVLSDEEDGSIRDCRNEPPGTGMCMDASDALDSRSSRWSSADLNLRFYGYSPCGPQDPTWSVDRYAHPVNTETGLTASHAAHPERVVFGAIAGVPLQNPSTPVNWASLLGRASAQGPDDYCGRETSDLVWTAPDGSRTSMRPANLDPLCATRAVPACYAEGSEFSSGCGTDSRYFAWPGRRLAEVARRFDESPRCDGQGCGNGYVASTCAADFGPAMNAIAQRIRRRL